MVVRLKTGSFAAATGLTRGLPVGSVSEKAAIQRDSNGRLGDYTSSADRTSEIAAAHVGG